MIKQRENSGMTNKLRCKRTYILNKIISKILQVTSNGQGTFLVQTSKTTIVTLIQTPGLLHWQILLTQKDRQIIDGKTRDGQTIDGQTIDEQTIDGQTINGQTIDGQTIYGQTIDWQTIDGQKIDEQTQIGGQIIDRWINYFFYYWQIDGKIPRQIVI